MSFFPDLTSHPTYAFNFNTVLSAGLLLGLQMERSDTEDDVPVDEDVKMVRAYVVRGSVAECFGFGLGITGALTCSFEFLVNPHNSAVV